MTTNTMKVQSEHSSPKYTALFKKILVAVDGSESSSRAANVAVELADKLGAELIVFHAISPPSSAYRTALPSMGQMAPPPPPQDEIDAYYAYAKRLATGIIGPIVTDAKKKGVNVKAETPEGVASVVETIIDHASNEKADLVILGTRGLGGFKKLLIGSVSSGVMTHARCPVMIVR